MKKKAQEPYKEPVLLFTSSSMRQAAWAGWYSAFGDKEQAEKFIHAAHAEWVKEVGGGRRLFFLDRFNHDIYNLDAEKLRELNDAYLKALRKEIKKNKRAMGKT